MSQRKIERRLPHDHNVMQSPELIGADEVKELVALDESSFVFGRNKSQPEPLTIIPKRP